MESNINTEKINNATGKKSRLKKTVIIILIIIVLLFLITLCAISPIMMNSMLNGHIDFNDDYKASDYNIPSKDLTLKTSDGVNIAAYEVYEADPKAVIIFISGIQNPSVKAFFAHAAALKEEGYASILMEMRAHGQSEGDEICVGYKEHLDVKAVTDYIKANDEYDNVPIIVYGLSMGGAVAINSAGLYEEIDGLISMSAFSSWEDVFCDNMANMGAPQILCAIEKPFVIAYSALRFGFNVTDIKPKTQIKNLGNRPALIYHSKNDSQIPYASFERIIKNAPKGIQTIVKDGDYHFPVENFDNPREDKEYMSALINFLDDNFAK